MLRASEDTWVCELKDPETFIPTSNHAISSITFKRNARGDTPSTFSHSKTKYGSITSNSMRASPSTLTHSRVGDDGEYVIIDTTLLLITSTAMLKTQQSPRVNDEWEDLQRAGKTWAKWKAMYKRGCDLANFRPGSMTPVLIDLQLE